MRTVKESSDLDVLTVCRRNTVTYQCRKPIAFIRKYGSWKVFRELTHQVKGLLYTTLYKPSAYFLRNPPLECLTSYVKC